MELILYCHAKVTEHRQGLEMQTRRWRCELGAKKHVGEGSKHGRRGVNAIKGMQMRSKGANMNEGSPNTNRGVLCSGW